MPGSTLVLALITGCILLSAPVALAAAPPNDDFANRELLSTSLPIEVTRSNVDATKEEPFENVGPFAAGHSVWFEWEASSTEWVTVGSCENPDFHTVLDVFTGTALSSLTRVPSGNASEGPHCPFTGSEFTFKATENTSYKIAVDGNAFYLPPAEPPITQGTFKLRIEATPPPPNDDFTSATTLEGKTTEEPGGARFYYASAFGYNWGAAKEAEEPDHAGDPGGASVWYQWTAPGTGTAHLGTCCGQAFLLAMYSGSSLNGLSPISSGVFGSLTAPVIAGDTYDIAIDGPQDESTGEAASGSFTLSASMQLPPLPPTEEQPVPSTSPMPADTTPPNTAISKRKLTPRRRKATFSFASSESGSTFLCKLDGHPFAACTSPKTYKHLKPGHHTFKVVAVDAAGNVDPSPAVARFRVPKQAKHGRKHRRTGIR